MVGRLCRDGTDMQYIMQYLSKSRITSPQLTLKASFYSNIAIGITRDQGRVFTGIVFPNGTQCYVDTETERNSLFTHYY